MAISIKITLDLEFALTYARRLIPVQLRLPYHATRELHLRCSLPFAPATTAVTPPEPRQLANA